MSKDTEDNSVTALSLNTNHDNKKEVKDNMSLIF